MGSEADSKWTPFTICGVTAALFILVVFGYLRLFPIIEASHPDHYAKNVDYVQSQGDIDRALKIARRATFVRPDDPLAYTVYGRVLLATGDSSEGLAQLHKAVNVRRELVLGAYQETRKYYYYAPARLTLGKYFFDQGNLPEAIAQFELARAYANISSEEYSSYFDSMYRAYSSLGLWARALEFREPSVADLEALAASQLAQIAHVCVRNEDWECAERVTRSLMAQHEYATEAYFLLGLITLKQKRYEASIANFHEAVSGRHVNAAYFLGIALEQSGQIRAAIETFVNAMSESVYRPFALGKAYVLFDNLPESEQNSFPLARQEILDLLDAEIAQLLTLNPPVNFDKYRRNSILAVRFPEKRVGSGGKFPILILWDDSQSPESAQPPEALSISDKDGSTFLLKRGGHVLALQWVDNLISWAVVESLPAGTDVIPGWIDSARDWFGLRQDHAARIAKTDSGEPVLNIVKSAWYYSVPVATQDDVIYLLTARYRETQARASLGWQFISDSEHVVSENNVLDQVGSYGTASPVAYTSSTELADFVRLQIVTWPGAGTVSFENVVLAAIEEPKM
jgi:tetratricopeptide (TPR) repeat protein